MSPFPAIERCAVTVARGPDGRAEVHKRATTAEQADRLAREATALRRARHPGVVDLVELRDEHEDGGAVLVTRLAGTHTLATWAPTLDELAGILVALAETLADLHHLGIVHGAVCAEHVVLAGDGRPALCGFERSREHRPADDVAALGRLTLDLLAADPSRPSDAASRREPRRRATARRRLGALADQAADPDEQARPGARRFAAAVVAAVPDAMIGPTGTVAFAADGDVLAAAIEPAEPGPADEPDVTDEHDRAIDEPTTDLVDETTDEPPEPVSPADATVRPDHARPTRRGLRSAVAVIGLACLVFGALSAWTGERPRLAAPSDAAPAPTRPTGTTATAPASNDGPGAVRARCEAMPAGCSAVVPGGVIEHGGSRFALGGPDDELVVADPGCTTPPAVALLRTGDGTTYVFDGWAEPGHDVSARRGPTVPIGSHWEPQPFDQQGCAALAIRTPDGATVAVAATTTEPPVTTAPVPDHGDPAGSIAPPGGPP